MDTKTLLASAAVSVAVSALTVPAMVSFVTLQPSTPGTPDAGHLNVSGYALASRFGAGVSPTLARVQVNETGSLQGVRSVTATGAAVYGQSNAATGTGAGGYFTSASGGGRAVVAEQFATSGPTVGGLFMDHSASGTAVVGRSLATGLGDSPIGVYGETSAKYGTAGRFKNKYYGMSADLANGYAAAVFSNPASGGTAYIGNTSGSFAYFTGVGGVDLAILTGTSGLFTYDGWGSSVDLMGVNGPLTTKGTPPKHIYVQTPVACVPIAYGTVDGAGNVYVAGSSNWTSIRANTGQYQVTVTGFSLQASNCTALATVYAAASALNVTTYDAGNGVLGFRITDGANTLTNAAFQFIVYKASGMPDMSPPYPDLSPDNKQGLSPKEYDRRRLANLAAERAALERPVRRVAGP